MTGSWSRWGVMLGGIAPMACSPDRCAVELVVLVLRCVLNLGC